jgi:UDP-glucose 4-epimerase
MSPQGLHTVAVLGGLGFIGSSLCRALVKAGYNVIVFNRAESSNSRVRDFEDNIKIIRGNIACHNDVINAIRNADTLIHLIHSTVPQASMDDASQDVVNNVASTVNWASRLNQTNVKRIIYVSSGGTVYGNVTDAFISEENPTNPVCSYGITKLMIEKYISMYASMHGIKSLIVRPSNIYGEEPRLDRGQGVIGTFASHALHGEELKIFGTGGVVRDYLFVDDLVSAILGLIRYDGQHSLFNAGCGIGHSVLDILDILRQVLGPLPTIEHLPTRSFDVPSNVLNSNLLKKEVGWQPEVSLKQGILRVIDSLKGRNDV